MNPTSLLLVDDDDAFRIALGGELERLRFAVTLAASGEEALSRLAGSDPDVVLRMSADPGNRIRQFTAILLFEQFEEIGQCERVDGCGVQHADSDKIRFGFMLAAVTGQRRRLAQFDSQRQQPADISDHQLDRHHDAHRFRDAL